MHDAVQRRGRGRTGYGGPQHRTSIKFRGSVQSPAGDPVWPHTQRMVARTTARLQNGTKHSDERLSGLTTTCGAEQPGHSQQGSHVGDTTPAGWLGNQRSAALAYPWPATRPAPPSTLSGRSVLSSQSHPTPCSAQAQGSSARCWTRMSAWDLKVPWRQASSLPSSGRSFSTWESSRSHLQNGGWGGAIGRFAFGHASALPSLPRSKNT